MKRKFHKCRECGKKLPYPEAFDTESSVICTSCCRKLYYQESGEMRPEENEDGTPYNWVDVEGTPEWAK